MFFSSVFMGKESHYLRFLKFSAFKELCDGRCGGGKNQINVQVISARCGAPIEMINIVREKGVDWDEESSSKGEDTGKMEKS